MLAFFICSLQPIQHYYNFARTNKQNTIFFVSVDLLSLLQWKTHPERIKVALERVLILNGEELVKFLQDVLDALFSIFSTEDGNSNDHSGPVFHVLVSDKCYFKFLYISLPEKFLADETVLQTAHYFLIL